MKELEKTVVGTFRDIFEFVNSNLERKFIERGNWHIFMGLSFNGWLTSINANKV